MLTQHENSFITSSPGLPFCTSLLLLEFLALEEEMLPLWGDTTGEGAIIFNGLSTSMLPAVVCIFCVDDIFGEKLAVLSGTP